jgi:hypothetical protein
MSNPIGVGHSAKASPLSPHVAPAVSQSSSARATVSTQTDATLAECEQSARFWSACLPKYGQKMRNLADRYAIFSAALAAVTGLSVWGALANSTQLWAVITVSLTSLATSMLTAIPKIKGWSECAGATPILASKYGHAIGELQNARAALKAGSPGAAEQASKARAEFEATRNEKNFLKPYPSDLQAEVEELRRKSA